LLSFFFKILLLLLYPQANSALLGRIPSAVGYLHLPTAK
jgi:F0F1-type ATP synthase beta subunit